MSRYFYLNSNNSMSLMAHQAGVFTGFLSIKRLGVFLLPPPPLDGTLVHRWVNPSSKFAGTHLYTMARVKRGTVRVKCLAQEHNTVPRDPGLQPGPFDPEYSALTIRLPRLPLLLVACLFFM